MVGLTMLLLFCLGRGLDDVLGTVFFQVLPALWLLFIQPGLSILTLFYGKAFSRLERLFLALGTSIIFHSAILYGIYLGLNHPITSRAFLTSSLSAMALLSLLEILLGQRRHPRAATLHLQKPVTLSQLEAQLHAQAKAILGRVRRQLSKHRPLLYAAFSYILILLVHFQLYPFLPEADSYPLVLRVREIISTGANAQISYRPFFPLFSVAYTFLTGLDVMSLYKFVFPLMLGICLIPLYLLARRYTNRPLLLWLSPLIPVSFPVFIQEAQISRPQTAIILLSFAVLWLLMRFAQSGRWPLYILALIYAIFASSFHELALFLLAVTALCGVPVAISEFRRRPKQALALTLYLLIALYPYTEQSGILKYALRVQSTFFRPSDSQGFRWWFLGHYINGDGQDLGWPGSQAWLYYGYNLGIFFITLLGIYLLPKLWRRKRPNLKLSPAAPSPLLSEESPSSNFGRRLSFLPAWSLLLIGLFFAEVTPRFGAALLPDRAWLYISIALSFLLVPWLCRLEGRAVAVLLVGGMLASVSAGWMVTWIKQGWIQADEYQAALWIRRTTPADSRVLSQTTNMPLIGVYAERDFLANNDFFLATPNQQATTLQSIAQLPPTSNELTTEVNTAELELWQRIQARLMKIRDEGNPSSFANQQKDIQNDLATWFTYRRIQASQLSSQPEIVTPPPLPPLYILYSERKFDSFYGQRSWWKTAGAYGANLEQLRHNSHLQSVYSHNGVYVWKVTL